MTGGKAAVLAAFLLLAAPRPAAAQVCEPLIAPIILVEVLEIVQDGLIDAAFGPPDGLLEEMLKLATLGVQQVVAGDMELTAQLTVPVVGDVIGVLNDASAGLLGSIPVVGPLISGFDVSQGGLSYGGIGYMDRRMRQRLDRFWDQASGGLRAMTAQLHASGLNTARMLSSMDDAGSLSGSALAVQDREIDDKLKLQVSGQSCQFDTMARSLGPAQAVSTAMSTAFSEQYNGLGNLKTGTPGARGPAEFRRVRFQKYRDKFCDVNSNGGNAPCSAAVKVPPGTTVPTPYGIVRPALAVIPTAAPLAGANAAISPSSTLFSEDTLDMTNPDKLDAVTELVTNITGYEPPEPVPKAALQSAAGKHQLQINREYVTKMDAIGALVWGVVGDRAPAAAAPEVQQMRQKVGQPNASPTPSEKEILNAVLDNLSNPGYYVDMNSGGGTVLQKQVYLKAYNAMLIYKLLEKQEKIANAYAIETANMVRKLRDVGMGQNKDSPVH